MIALKGEILESQGIYLSPNEPVAGNKTVFLFPGHGSQYPNMMKELAEIYPVVKDTFAEADEVYQELTGAKLTEKIFYKNDEQKAVVEENLSTAEVMQPSIYTANMAMYRLIKPMCREADVHLGHSLGEIAALAAAGVFSLADGLKIAYHRACSLNKIAESARGTMISLKINIKNAKLTKILEDINDYCTISLHNSPEQVVISGTSKAIDLIATKCQAEKVACHKLAVSHAFHSRLLEPAVEYFRDKLMDFSFRPAKVKVFSTIFGDFYNNEQMSTSVMASILSSQLVTPFSFCDIVSKLHAEHEANVFIEVGPKDILTRLVKTVLKDKQVFSHASNLPAVGDVISLERVKAYLAVNKLHENICKNIMEEPESAIRIEEGESVAEQRVKDIIHSVTGYPLSSIIISSEPAKLNLALNNKVYKTVMERIDTEFDLRGKGLVLDEKISLQEICYTIKVKSGIKNEGGAVKNLFLVKTTEAEKKEAANQPSEIAGSGAVSYLAERGEVEALVKEIIQQKTGYPLEMLENELDFEADLGIDSVKQAEIFGQIREKYGYEVNPDLNIKQFNTISKVVKYTLSCLREMKNESGPQASATTPGQAEETTRAVALQTRVADRNEVEAVIKEIIQQKTGYPLEMLENELDFEADLGIDSVKQAEIFGLIREKYGYEVNPDLNIKQFNTISKVVEYTLSRLAEATSATIENKIQELSDEQLYEEIINYSSENIALRYLPVTVEREYDAANGRPFSFKNKNFIIVEDRLGGEITSKLAEILSKQEAQVCVISPNPEKYKNSAVKTDYNNYENFKESLEKAKELLKDIYGFIYLYPLSQGLSYLDCADEQWHKEVENNFNLLFFTAKAVYEFIEKHGNEAGCFAATNIGGVFGMEQETSCNPSGALTAGFIKSLEKEIKPFNGKVVDFTDVTNSRTVAETLFKEFSLIEELIEIGYVNERRKTICVLPSEIHAARVNSPLKLGADDVIVVSGGGRGIIHECVRGLAEVFNPTIIVTGRTALPEGNEEWLNISDERFAEYSMEFFKIKKRESPDLTPLMIKQELEKIKGAIELYDNIRKAKEFGYNIHYLRCDVSDRNSVRKLAEEIKTRWGKVTGIVNGAGLPSFGKVPKKPEEHSLTVVRVKANGFYNLYREFSDQPLKFFTSIGSISGRFGMDGQVDYAGGADIIVRMSFQMFRQRPELKCFVMGWTAWDEVGMAADLQVQKVQKEQRGLEFISVNEGIQKFLCEIVYGGDYPEVLYYGSLGTNRPLGQMDLLDEAGKNIIAYYGKSGEISDRINYPLLQRVTNMGNSIMEVSKDLNIKEDIYLKDHLVEGKFVYAGVMHVEAFSELGALLNQTSGDDSELVATRIHSVEFNKFVKYFEGSPLTIKLRGEVVEKNRLQKEIKVELSSDFINKQGMLLDKDRLHSSGYVVFERQFPTAKKPDADVIKDVLESKPMNLEKYYDLIGKFIFFGPVFRCLDYVGYVSDDILVGRVTVPDDRQIFSYTAKAETIISPITVDNIGRLMLFNDFHNNGNIIVPRSIGNAVLYRPFRKGEKVYVYCKRLRDNGETVDYKAQVVDENNNLIFEIMNLQLIRIAKEYGDHNLF
jgi:acyl carrier protein